MSIRAVIFDFDGLILDTESTDFQSWQEVFAAHTCKLRFDIWAESIGRPWGYFDPYAHLEQLSGAPIDRDRIHAQRQARLRELFLLQPIQPGVLAYLRDAQQLGLKIGLASSSDRAWVHGHLERLGLLPYFTVTRCFEDTGAHKPDPTPYLAVLEALDVLPSEAVAFEDSPNGIASAKAAGILCVAVPNPTTRSLNLDKADYRLDSLASLPLQKLLSRLTSIRFPEKPGM
jgi:HAD superfamily hydrolase (TIGR01509 family)